MLRFLFILEYSMTKNHTSAIFEFVYISLVFLGCTLLVIMLSYDAFFVFNALAYKVVTAFILFVIWSNITAKLTIDLIRLI